jgi:predicted RNA binding protein YcfA (HicA-like mRNA interferase family)
MSKREKLRQRLRQNPVDGNLQDVKTLLERFNFSLARVRGSHYIFEYEDQAISKQIVFPSHGNKVKKIYIREVIKILDELFPPHESDFEDDLDE